MVRPADGAAIQRGVHCSVEALERDIRAFIAATNVDPKPFRRVKSAYAILASVRRFCLRTLDAATEDPSSPQTSGAGHQHSLTTYSGFWSDARSVILIVGLNYLILAGDQ